MSCNNQTVIFGSGAVVVRSPASSNCPPSPAPPWGREGRAPISQTLFEAGNVSLTTDITYLDKVVSDPPAPQAITIPNGNRKGQFKQIIIQGSKLATTETWNLAGTFAGYTSLTFNAIGNAAMLVWNGDSWTVMGGNVTTNV